MTSDPAIVLDPAAMRLITLFVCSDMWKPYLRVIRERCVEARRLAQDGYQPVLKKTKW
jgi:hypothetical protein